VENDLPKKGIEVTSVDITDPDAVAAAIRPNTRVLFAESVSNPNMRVADIPALAELAKEHGLVFIVDNTFLGPSLLRPLEHGADLVVHSATKYLAGHGDALAGAVVGRRELIDPIRYMLDVLGSPASPFNSWLVLRGVRTLPLRMEAHCRNAAALAAFLEAQPEVEQVLYPGLDSHPDRSVARRLLDHGSGGMLAFRLRSEIAAMDDFADALEMCELSVSLGDVFTLVYPMPRRNDLIRVSVGCEDVEDIVADFARALRRAGATRR
jgi:cystathionine beta-lyase/cystathionine gamma-synthase